MREANQPESNRPEAKRRPGWLVLLVLIVVIGAIATVILVGLRH